MVAAVTVCDLGLTCYPSSSAPTAVGQAGQARLKFRAHALGSLEGRAVIIDRVRDREPAIGARVGEVGLPMGTYAAGVLELLGLDLGCSGGRHGLCDRVLPAGRRCGLVRRRAGVEAVAEIGHLARRSAAGGGRMGDRIGEVDNAASAHALRELQHLGGDVAGR